MGRGYGGGGRAGLNAFARKRGLTVTALAKGQYKFAIRGDRANMRANTITQARKLISSTHGIQRKQDRQLAAARAAARQALTTTPRRRGR